MGGVIGFIQGAVLIAGGVFAITTGNVGLGISLISSGALVIMGQFAIGAFQDGVRANVTGSQTPLPIVYGEAKIGHANVDVRANGSDNERLHIVAALCVASEDGNGIQEIDDIWFNGVLAVNNPTFPTNVLGGILVGVQSPFAHGSEKFIRYALHAGLDLPSVDLTMNDRFPTAWPTTSLGRGIAYAMMRLKFDKEDEDKIFATGIPKIEYVIRGNRVFDPRFPNNGPNTNGYVFLESDTDASITYNPGQNPGLCLYDYLKSAKYGMNIPLARLNEQSFIDLANHCDEDVNPAGLGNQARYTCNGALSTGDDHKTNIEKLLSSCNSNLIWIGGEVVVQPRKSTTAETFELNKDNIVSAISIVRSGTSIPNTVSAKFPDFDNDWSVMDVVWPEIGSNAFLTTDNDNESLLELDFPLTTNFHTAQQLAMIALKELREDVAVELTATEDAMVLLTGDIVKLTYDTAGFSAKEFRVVHMDFNDDSTVTIKLREYDTSVYSLDVQQVNPTVPGTDLPDPFTVTAPTNLTLLSDDSTALILADGTVLPRVYATWDQSLDSFLDHETVQWRVGTDEWKDLAAPRVSDATVGGQQEIYSPPVSEGEVVHFNIRAVNSLGVASAPLTGSEVATGKAIPPATVTGFSALLGPNGVYRLSWDGVTDSDLSHYEVRYGGANWAAATVLGTRIDSTLWAFLARDLGAAARSTTLRVKAFDRSGNESVVDDTVALSDPTPVAVAPTSVLSRNGIITVTVNTTTTESSGMRLYASTTTSFTPGNANRVAGEVIPEGGLGAQDISFAIPAAMNGVTVYMRLGFVDALTFPLGESETLNTEFSDTGVDPAGGGDLPPVIIESSSESSGTGTLALTVTDPQGSNLTVRFYTRVGTNSSWSTVDTRASVVSGTTENDTVSLDEDKAAFIKYEVDNAAGFTVGGIVQFDPDIFPTFHQLGLAVDDTGKVTASWIGDSDFASIKVLATVDPTVPTQANTRLETAINGRVGTTGTLVTLAEGETANVRAFGYSVTGGGGVESVVFAEAQITFRTDTDTQIPNTDTSPPEVQITMEVDANGISTTAIVPIDPSGFIVTPYRFRHSVSFNPLVWSTWADENGAPFDHVTTLLEDHSLLVNWEYTYDLGLGDGNQVVRGIVTYDPDKIPALTTFNLMIDETGEAWLEYVGDDDVDHIRWKRVINGSVYPTLVSNDVDGTLKAGRAGQVSVDASVAEGDTLWLSVYAYDDKTPPANPSSQQYKIKVTRPVDTDTLPSNLPEITALALIVRLNGDVMFHYAGNEHVASIKWAERNDSDGPYANAAAAYTAAKLGTIKEGQSDLNVVIENAIPEGDRHYVAVVAYDAAGGGGTVSEIAYTDEVVRPTDTLPSDPSDILPAGLPVVPFIAMSGAINFDDVGAANGQIRWDEKVTSAGLKGYNANGTVFTETHLDHTRTPLASTAGRVWVMYGGQNAGRFTGLADLEERAFPAVQLLLSGQWQYWTGSVWSNFTLDDDDGLVCLAEADSTSGLTRLRMYTRDKFVLDDLADMSEAVVVVEDQSQKFDTSGRIIDDLEMVSASSLYIPNSETVRVGSISTPSFISKKILISHTLLIPISDQSQNQLKHVDGGGGYAHNVGAHSGAKHNHNFVIPQGCKITTVQSRLFRNNNVTSHAITLLIEVGTSETVTTKATLTHTGASPGTYQLKSSTPSYVIPADKTWRIQADIGHNTLNTDARYQYSAIFYQMPEYQFGY